VRSVTARSWCRVDLAGGTLDIWPLGLFHPGARTVNVAINLAATVRMRPADRYRVRQGESLVEADSAAELAADPNSSLAGVVAVAFGLPPVEIEQASQSPRGGGLGGSSALAVALIAAAEELLGKKPSSAMERAHLARDLEARLMLLPTGMQDHYPGLLGGALEIRMEAGGEVVRQLAVDLDALGDHLMVVYSGVSHFSAGQNWQVVRRRLDGEPESVALFSGIAEAAAGLGEALEAGDFPRVGSLMALEWSFRRRLAEGVSTPEFERLLEAARELGAWGGKACGAGGGGCLALLCPPERRAEIGARLAELGGKVLPARPTSEPLSVIPSDF
jgi:D-glycero-alpha-D-manno-heptose-7-phosphate kinase